MILVEDLMTVFAETVFPFTVADELAVENLGVPAATAGELLTTTPAPIRQVVTKPTIFLDDILDVMMRGSSFYES